MVPGVGPLAGAGEGLLEPGLDHGRFAAGVHDFDGINQISTGREQHLVNGDILKFETAGIALEFFDSNRNAAAFKGKGGKISDVFHVLFIQFHSALVGVHDFSAGNHIFLGFHVLHVGKFCKHVVNFWDICMG